MTLTDWDRRGTAGGVPSSAATYQGNQNKSVPDVRARHRRTNQHACLRAGTDSEGYCNDRDRRAPAVRIIDTGNYYPTAMDLTVNFLRLFNLFST